MKNISFSKIGRLPSNIFQQFMKSVPYLYENLGEAIAPVEKRFNLFNEVTLTVGQVYKTNTKHDLTPELDMLDEKRTKALFGLKKAIESFLYDEDATLAAASEALLENYNFNIGTRTKMSLPKKTSKIESLLKDLETVPALGDAVAKLNFQDRVKSLEAVNSEYFKIYLERIKSRRQLKLNEEVRKTMLARFEALVLHTEAHLRLSSDPTYEALMDDIEGLYIKYTSLQTTREREKVKAPPPSQVASSDVVETMGGDTF